MTNLALKLSQLKCLILKRQVTDMLTPEEIDECVDF